MAKEDNLKPFTAGFDEKRNLNGRPKGSKNRSTIAKKWLEVNSKEVNPITKELEDFYKTFPKGKNIKYEDYITWANKFINDMADMAYVEANWEYLVNGNENIYDEMGLIEIKINIALTQ